MLTQIRAATMTNTPPSYTTCLKRLRDQERCCPQGHQLRLLRGLPSTSRDSQSVCSFDHFDHLPDDRPPHHAVPVSGRLRRNDTWDESLRVSLTMVDRTRSHLHRSTPICRDFVEYLGHRCAEACSFGQVADGSQPNEGPSLPLIEILVNKIAAPRYGSTKDIVYFIGAWPIRTGLMKTNSFGAHAIRQRHVQATSRPRYNS
ncbi:hypothetical protein EDB84DRAFT_650940 [Lactarius hengduanensis]|nr:hypothetical protein EDB84DRAFT_650940 [Lactarius hengduanensis]